MKTGKLTSFILFITAAVFLSGSCNFITHSTLSKDNSKDSLITEPEPDYDVSLDFEYQDFTSYLYMGNRIENFTAYFNTFFKSQEDYNEAFDEFRTSFIAVFNRSIDSLLVDPPVTQSVKDKLNKSIERSSKIIQFHRNSKFIDDAVLLIGKSYYLLNDYINAERKFNEFLSKFSSSELTDEALLYLARTKNKLGNQKEAESLYKSLLDNDTESEMKSLAARDFGVLEYKNGRPEEAAKFFRKAIEYSNDNVRKAEGQFVLAKLLSLYKPELSATEYKKVLNYTSDFDLSFYGRVNYAIGLTYNKKYNDADEELTSLRSKYRDEVVYAQLVDLEIANNYYAQKKLKDAMDKYYEVIVKYPNTVASSNAYYFLGKHEEEVNSNYLKALVNYTKSSQENSASEYNKIVTGKVTDLGRYFSLQSEVSDSEPTDIPQENFEVEKYRAFYNEEMGIEQFNESNKSGDNKGSENSGEDDGRQRGDGKGKPGGFRDIIFIDINDSLENPDPGNSGDDPNVMPNPGNVTNPGNLPNPGNMNNPGNMDNNEKKDGSEIQDTSNTVNLDSIKKVQEEAELKTKEDKIFNGYYELAEIFNYKLNKSDSAEFYLKLLLQKFDDPEKRSKVLYTLGNFYVNVNDKVNADETFGKLIAEFPGSLYAFEAKKILGLEVTRDDVVIDSTDAKFNKAIEFYNGKNFEEALNILRQVDAETKLDSVKAKSLYGIGFVYENGLSNKDSSLFYYKKLRETYPESVYSLKVSEILDYYAMLEENEKADSLSNVSDTLKTGTSEINESGEDKEKISEEENKNPENPDIKTDDAGDEERKQLTPEETEQMLKESETDPNNPPGN